MRAVPLFARHPRPLFSLFASACFLASLTVDPSFPFAFNFSLALPLYRTALPPTLPSSATRKPTTRMSSARAYSPFAVLLVLVLVFAHLTTAVSALAVTSGSRAPSSINGRVQRRSTSVVRHILKRQEVPELDLTAFPTLEECNVICCSFSLFLSLQFTDSSS